MKSWTLIQIVALLTITLLVGPACCTTKPTINYKPLPPPITQPTIPTAVPLNRAHLSTVTLIKRYDGVGCAGVIVQNKKGRRLFVLTAAHCMAKMIKISPEITVGSVKRGWKVQTELVAIDVIQDLALLRSKRPMDRDGVFVELAPSEPAVASLVYVIGNPDKIEHNIALGILSNSFMVGQQHMYRTDAAVWYGNSGGGLFNIKGQLIGIVVELEPSPGACVITGGGRATALPAVRKFLEKYLAKTQAAKRRQ